ncbi:piRNA biogenesis protein EXD1 isoform X2 [Betta splendens]|uniref:PiRNA biogenesis protein EXD1 isoform X2 n=1 Tax=Betta splendens TaxID=158456 RepID=A0A6P7LJX5_BETSP|nr:piRNA biogenesis protein EXD1 isoform X2 [Betta splendens]
MVEDDVQFMSVFRSRRIKLTLQTSSYFGVVQRINRNRTVVLADVVCCSNGNKIPGSKMFFGHEIVNVAFAEEAAAGSGHALKTLEDQLTVKRFRPHGTDNDDEDELINFVVIDEFHEKFGSAVWHIKKQSVIGVGADGVDAFDQGRLSWLQIATNNRVYLFDILLLGARAFKNGLTMILENKHVLKVVHDCRAIAGCLIAQFGVKLTNVFDTQVADVMCFYSETGGFLPNRVSTLQEVVRLHLKVPSSQHLPLQMKSELTKEEREMWCKRPCPVPLLKVMALSVIHLQPLRLALLDTLMTDYMAAVDGYLNSSYYDPDKLQQISMDTVLELPKELMQLDEMHRQRHDWAANHYPVTKQGLLDRFNPRTLSPPQTPHVVREQGQTKQQEDAVQPTPMQPLTSTQADLLHQPPMNPKSTVLSTPSMDVPASPSLPAQGFKLSRHAIAIDNPSVDVGIGHTEVLMNAVGRGRPSGNKQLTPPLPAIGRGFLPSMPPAHATREGGHPGPEGRNRALVTR